MAKSCKLSVSSNSKRPPSISCPLLFITNKSSGELAYSFHKKIEMKKKYLYILLLLLIGGLLGFTIMQYSSRKNDSVAYTIKDRKGNMRGSAEWVDVRKKATGLMNRIQTQPNDQKSKLALSALFIQEGRITGNHDYYDMAAMKYVEDVLKADSNNFEALLYKAVILLSQHRFTDAIDYAEKVKKLNPYNAFTYGILVDGSIEMGNYEAAVEYSDKMVSIRPDIRSYARISYLREIHGDYPGAIEAMKLAIGAGIPGDETSEWARVQLGKLYEHTGQLKEAEVQYRIAEEQRPHYAQALEGLARIAEANKNYTEAASLLKRADAEATDYGFRLGLSRIYTLIGDEKQAANILEEVIKEMKADAEMESRSDKGSHHADQELAEAYLIKGDVEKALKHAFIEYERRPGNIEVNEQLAWTYYHGKQYTKALQHIQTALSTGSKNPTLLHRAGLISAKIGDTSLAKKR